MREGPANARGPVEAEGAAEAEGAWDDDWGGGGIDYDGYASDDVEGGAILLEAEESSRSRGHSTICS